MQSLVLYGEAGGGSRVRLPGTGGGMAKRGTGAAAEGGVVTAPDLRGLGKTEKEGSVVRHDKAFEAV